MAGLPASGKSAISERLKNALNAVLLNKDKVRACLFENYVEYSREQDDLCVDMMYQIARYHLKKRPTTPVILDGRTYSRTYQIEAAKQAAILADTTICIIECVCSPTVARMRLKNDRYKHIAQDRDELMYEKSRASAEPITEPRLVLETDKANEEQCEQTALAYLKRLLS